MKETMPKISIITITYNSEKTVRETFESVKRQNYDNLEYIVVDGGSTDSTLAIAEEYKDIITKLVSEKDNGISDAMNKGINLATGDIIGIIHSDDALVDDALKVVAETAMADSDVIYGNAIILHEDGTPSHILEAKEDISGLPYSFCLVHPAVFVTKKAYLAYGVFDETFKCAMDYELFLRFYRQGAKFQHINGNLAIYREGGTNMKFRRQTINEVCAISIKYGGNKFKARAIKCKKIMRDKLKKILPNGTKNKRVKPL